MIDKDIFKDLFGISLKINVEKLSTSDNPQEASLCFGLTEESFDKDRLLKIDPMLIFTTENILFSEIIEQKHQILRFKNPRMQYIKLLRKCSFNDDDIFYTKKKQDESLYFKHKSAYISDKAVIHPFSYVGANCHISDYVVLMPGAKLLQNTFVDSHSVIGSNTVIGEWGFSIERENDKSREAIPRHGIPQKMPHFGGVRIGKKCHIGALNTIASGTIVPTTIGDYLKTDDHVHIAHNCQIGIGVAMTAHVEISGSVNVEDGVWLGPNCSIMQKVTIGKDSVIGIGATVLKDVEPNSLYAGSPAKKYKDYE
jgi:UDP-3-O-[3-hydroxymyristoyl] glucosamine N-acyltransferase LpxD